MRKSIQHTWRVYYWFKSAPEDRPGGPWWYRDFTVLRQAQEFLQAQKPFLKAWAWLDSHDEYLPQHTMQDIYPPKDSHIVHEEG